MTDITDLSAGVAAEHLVCADLLLQGYRAFLADQNCPYDVAVEVDGRLVRVQCKSTRVPKKAPSGANHFAYFFYTRRAGKGAKRLYSEKDYDILALVALDIRRIAYVAMRENMSQTLNVRVPGRKYVPHRSSRTFDQCPFQSALASLP